MNAAAYRYRRLRAMLTKVEGDFRPGIPHANNQNALALERCCIDVSSTVEASPSKFLGSWESRRYRLRIQPRRHDQVWSAESLCRAFDQPPISLLAHRMHVFSE